TAGSQRRASAVPAQSVPVRRSKQGYRPARAPAGAGADPAWVTSAARREAGGISSRRGGASELVSQTHVVARSELGREQRLHLVPPVHVVRLVGEIEHVREQLQVVVEAVTGV